MEYSYTGLYVSGIENGFIVAERADSDGCELIEIGWGPVELPEGVYLDDVVEVSEGLAIYRDEDGLYGYINTEGEIVIPAQFDAAYDFRDGYAEIGLLDEVEVHAIIDRSGSVVISGLDAAYCGVVDGALFIMEAYSAWSLVEPDGTVRCRVEAPEGCYNPWLYQFAEDGPLWVSYEREDEPCYWGIADTDGQWLTEPGLYVSFDTDEPWLAVGRDGRWGYTDVYGNTVLPFEWMEAESFDGALAWVAINECTEAYINREGKVVRQWTFVDDGGQIIE